MVATTNNAETARRAGTLTGVRIIELAGLGPGPFCGMMLADHGADVIRIDRMRSDPGITGDASLDFLNRSRTAISIDLKNEHGVALVLRLCKSADGLIEGYRPGVMERLGLGPAAILAANPRLVYGRMTGWGQYGPHAHLAGHDIDYIALSGALHACGRSGEKPLPPLNLVGDFGGGGMMLAFAMLAGILHARQTGVGQVVDCAMTDGSALLMSMIYSMRASGHWLDTRGGNMLDSGAHFYDTYETAEGRFVAIGSIEPQFYRRLLELIGLADDEDFGAQFDRSRWPRLRTKLAALFRTKTRDEWCRILQDTDACFAPVLSMGEAPGHPHNVARQTFIDVQGAVQPAPAPRYSATPAGIPKPMNKSAEGTAELLASIGYSATEVAQLRTAGVVA
jgi:alpha-methylacyl-CoA racemase